MALYRRGRFWWVSMWIGGKHVSKSTKLEDKKKAKAVESALKLTGWAVDGSGTRLTTGAINDADEKAEVINGLLRAVYGVSVEKVALSSLWDEYESVSMVKGKDVTEKHCHDKKNCLDRFVKWASKNNVEFICQVGGGVARRYASYLAKDGTSAKRRQNVFQQLSSIWNAAKPNHRNLVNPWPVVSPSNVKCGERPPFTKAEEERVLIAGDSVHPQWRVASTIARYTGLRYSDVCNLTYGEVDFCKGVIETVPGKTKHSSGVKVIIPMATPLRVCLRRWAEGHPRHRPDDRVLPWMVSKGPKGDHRFSCVLKKAKIDTENHTFHTWRITLATRLAEAGADIEVRQKILGHTTMEMAEHYNKHEYVSELKDVLEKTA